MTILSNCFKYLVLYFFINITLLYQAGAETQSFFINLDPQNSSSDYITSFTEGNGPVNITADNALIEDLQNIGLRSLTITITNLKSGDMLSVDTSQTSGIIFQYDDNKGVLSLTSMIPGGWETAANYQQALRNVKFNNTSQNPDTSERIIEFAGTNGENISNQANCRLQFIAVNNEPVNTVPQSQVTPKNIDLIFSMNGGNRISISDADIGTNDIQVNLSIDQGTLTITKDLEITIQGNGTSSLILTGRLELINSALDGLKYEPVPDWHGIVMLTIITNDLGYTGTPGAMADTDMVKITVGVTTGPSQPPVADAGQDISAKEYSIVYLDSSNSSDPDGEIVAHKWTQIHGTQVTLYDAETSRPYFTVPEIKASDNILIFQVMVIDNENNQDIDTIIISIESAEVDGIFNEGETIILNAQESEDIVSYQWTQISGKPVFLSDPNSAQTSFVSPIVGQAGEKLAFNIMTENNQGIQASYQIIVVINDNKIKDFSDDILTFRPTTSTQMGIKISNGNLVNLKSIHPDDIADAANKPISMFYGLLDIKIQTMPGDTIVTKIYFQESVEDEYKWFNYQKNDGWHEYVQDIVFSLDKMNLTLTITDGGYGDNDKEANGIIQSLFGLGKPSTDQTSGAGDSGGGCFILMID